MVESRKELNNGKYIDDQMGNGVPEGGTTGQVLTKASNDDYDTEWAAGGGGSQNLQDVTDIGNTTTNEIVSNGLLTPYVNIQSTSRIGNIRGDNLTSLFNRYLQLPNADGTFALSVNGNLADSNGNITVSTSSTGFEMNLMLMGG